LRLCCGLLGIGQRQLNPFSVVKCVGGFIFLVAVFVAVILPRLEFSQKKFGDRFHTYPGYWMWMDDFDSGFKWMAAHPNRDALSEIPPAEKPSPLNYWRSHSFDEIRERASTGWIESTERSLFPKKRKQSGWKTRGEWKHLLPHRGWYLIGLTGILLGAAVVARRYGEPSRSYGQSFVPRATSSDRFLAVTFVATLFVGYSMAYG
jgi:hypothetical protein